MYKRNGDHRAQHVLTHSCPTLRSSVLSITKVRLRSMVDCEIRCTRSCPNVANTTDSFCSSERMPRPTRVMAAHGAITLTRQTFARSADSSASTSVLTRFSLGSSDTVTLVSDEPIRSTDRDRKSGV